ncbi:MULTISPECIES: ABC transporter substrate-binding protein [unclassified Roseitalea]|uniref:ABC transporter substrate-binding protein n=1 Tax=unclassified Roseitalea TaxID=2639107 RepID=UPI00273FDBD0|nr:MULTISPECIES: ABC transporter substrate-binding protein [unclassified Roseitalea]
MKRDLQPCQFGRRASAARLASTAGAALIAAAVSVGSAQGQTVTLAQGVDPESLDPALDTLITSVGVMMNIYDSLVWRDADGNIVPGLAESWEFPEPDRMELTLRQGVTFHNGEPFNADDVVFSYQRLFDEDNPSPLLTSLRGFVDSVEKVDDYTVAVNMPGPRATVVPTLIRVPILPEETFAEIGPDAFGSAPVGTGPFEFVRWDKNQQIVLERNEDYWRGPAAIERFVVRPIPEDFSRFASLRNGEVDIIANVTAERVEEIKGDPGLKIGTVPSVRNMFVGMQTAEPPFDDVRVRRALNHAVDKQALIDVIMGGFGRQNASVCTQTLFGAAEMPLFDYDVDKARTLLSEAGYEDGFEIEMLGPVGRYTKDKELQEAIAGMLSEVGVRVTHVQPEWAEFIRLWVAEEYPMHLIGTGNQVVDCDQHLGYRIHGPRYGRYYQSDEVDALVEEQLREYDTEKRKQILADIQREVREDAPWIFLFDLVDIYGLTARIDWQPRPDEMVWAYDISVSE